MAMTDSIPFTLFDSDALESSDRFDAWRQSIAPIFEASPLKDESKPFKTRVEAYHLGHLMAGWVSTQAQHFRHAQPGARVDHILVQVYCVGGYVGNLGGSQTRVDEGHVSIIDLAQSLETVSGDTDIINLMLPRDSFAHRPGFLNKAHGLALTPERNAFLGDYLKALLRRLPNLSCCEAPEVARITRDMVIACSAPDAEARERVAPQLEILMRERIKRFIDRNLASRLSPDTLCKAAGLSRARLYRLFESEGGVARFIQQRRLARVRECLENTAETRSIGKLAEAHGFRNQAHFARCFRAQYQMSPRDVRQLARQGIPLLVSDKAFSSSPCFSLIDWVRQLGH